MFHGRGNTVLFTVSRIGQPIWYIRKHDAYEVIKFLLQFQFQKWQNNNCNSLPTKFILDWIETEHPHIEMNSYKKIKTWEGRQSKYILVGEWCPNILVVINYTFDYVTGCHGNR